jgi:hypothetical protein
MDWRTANGWKTERLRCLACGHLDCICGVSACATCGCDVAEVEALRTEAARLLALFAEAKAHPASAWWYVEQALGGDPLPRRASLVGEPHSRQLAHDEPIPAHMLDSDHYRPRGLRGRDDQPQP